MPLSFQTALRDGTPLEIRRAMPGDDRHLDAILDQLSKRSLQHRFCCGLQHVPKNQRWRFTHPDTPDHAAWIAFDLSGDSPQPVGAGRYVQSPDNPARAEFAETIIDSHQGRGLGAILMATVIRGALAARINELEAQVMVTNRAMIEIFRELEGQFQTQDPGTLMVRIPLHPDPDAYPENHVGAECRRLFPLINAALADEQRSAA